MDMTSGSTNTVPSSSGYLCQNCGQWVYYSWGTHMCSGRAVNTAYYFPVDLSEVLKELRQIREELQELNRKTIDES